MARNPNIIRTVSLHTYIPEDLRAKMDLHLFSHVEGRIPLGAYSKFFEQLIRDFFARKEMRDASQS